MSALGKRATEYVSANAIVSAKNRDALVPERDSTPEGIARTLTRVYGRPETIDRGEVRYWLVPRTEVQA